MLATAGVTSRGPELNPHTRPHILADSVVPVPSAPLKDSNVAAYEPLVSPALLIHEFPITPASRRTIESARQGAAQIIQRNGDDRLLVIVGPCSIHDTDVARDYAIRLHAAIQEHGWDKDLLIVMRAYLEKPRTTVGWKGFLYDPNIDSTNQVNRGLKLQIARQLLLDITALGLPVACEVLDTISPQFLADLYSWGAVGARTTESQVHRQLVSGLSFPIGFKNGSSGNINIALDGMKSAASPHSFLGVTEQGLAAIVHTKGNPHLHVIHRGGDSGPNFDAASVASTVKAYPKNLQPSIMIDASHGNSQKDYRNQPKVIDAIAEQVAAGEQAITGVMIESNINEGKQAAPQSEDEVQKLKYGVSITDGCVGFETTVKMLQTLSLAVQQRRAAVCQGCENQSTCDESCPGPNPVKVAMALEHLGLDYNCVPLGFGEGKGTVKDPEYTSKVNPNGRVPGLIDHQNNEFTVFESAAILRYLAEKYDPSGKLAGNTPEERATVNQWLAWQVAGLGPYQGQLVWFLAFHEGAHGEKANASVIARYQAEVERLRSVLEKHLASAENGFVALGRLTIADFAILPWLKISVLAGSALKPFEEYPAIDAYIKKLDALPEVQAAYKKAVPPMQ
ncbi:uncharacterized protein CDV56_100674 [Aspergillus thermomutatus]|uniref:3-deoxy-7-phosphoheptulonate synthase n=1 Tax=Aspergillus thermomutatus TaxID=41047 RepID=A0A397GRB9_ASPTH|nr:uncharacterized protein CDV56_100674 [Aspergillus thermomutatus]RHZ52819.1 hypothetical protein CDV56_100674 [Aspergillus thermomutatus]